jgi:hypothetical protein
VIPGVFRGFKGGVFSGRTHGKFIHVQLADVDGPSSVEFFNDSGIINRHEVFQHFGSGSGGQVFGDNVVFDRYGNARQWLIGIDASRVNRFSLGLGLIVQVQKGVDVWIDFSDFSQSVLGQVCRSDRAGN